MAHDQAGPFRFATGCNDDLKLPAGTPFFHRERRGHDIEGSGFPEMVGCEGKFFRGEIVKVGFENGDFILLRVDGLCFFCGRNGSDERAENIGLFRQIACAQSITDLSCNEVVQRTEGCDVGLENGGTGRGDHLVGKR